MRSTTASGFLCALVAALLLCPAESHGEPYLAVREGLKCSNCHANQTGAGMRSAYGNIYQQTLLPMKLLGRTPPTPLFMPMINEFVSVGGDLRVSNASVLQNETESTNGFQIDEGNLYLRADVLPGFLGFYVDQSFGAGGTSNREALILLTSSEKSLFFKAGRMILPYGLAIWDDDASIRRKTGFNFSVQDLGMQLGWQPGPWDLNMTLSNGTQGGTENNKEKQFTSTAAWVRKPFRLGASYSINPGVGAKRQVGGIHAGFHHRRLDVLGEFDVIHDEDDEGRLQQYGNQRVAYVEANILFTQGLSMKVAYDFWDPFTDVGEDERESFRIGLEPFLAPFLQARIFYRHRKAPEQLESENRDEILFEVHAFF